MDVVLGIDVGKADFHCALLVDERCRSNSFPNSAAGFERLLGWLGHRKVERVHACLEATGGWSDELAAFLFGHGHAVSVVNPSTIKSFGQSELSRTKTDKADAALIARYCSAMKPRLWSPPSPSQRRLQAWGAVGWRSTRCGLKNATGCRALESTRFGRRSRPRWHF